ncbi:MAG TPA: hypothetical protein VJU02_01030 [Nitrospiraceae bacterium]|nr:hypothetical protein [Nitrospiraceae bacterium]
MRARSSEHSGKPLAVSSNLFDLIEDISAAITEPAGASHLTGWTGIVAKLIQIFCLLDPKQLLEGSIKDLIKKQVGQTGSVASPAAQRTIPGKGKGS